MRFVIVWVTAFILLFTITVGWYVSQPVVIGISRSLASSIIDANAQNVAKAIEYVSYLWGPLLDIFILVWAIVSSQKRDVESEVYG